MFNNLSTTISPAQKAAYLRTLPAIRERCGKVYDLAKRGELQYFEYHPEKESGAVEFCIEVMKSQYGKDGVVRVDTVECLDAGSPRFERLVERWSAAGIDVQERARRAIDLFVVSVLLDAGAGNVWRYEEKETGQTFVRTEGLGVASFRMFEAGVFSGVEGQPFRADGEGLLKLTPGFVAAAMQSSEENPLVGVEGRANLLSGLGSALRANPMYFGKDGRPGNIVDFLAPETRTDESGTVYLPLPALWHVLIDGFSSIWPSRHSLGGVALGDVWPCPALVAGKEAGALSVAPLVARGHISVVLPLRTKGAYEESDSLVPFHKLTQWLTYSLIEVFEKVLGWKVEGNEDMTGLPEYRNGGLLVDLGVLVLKPNALPKDAKSGLPYAEPSHPAIVEWRAMTVIGLDRLADGIRKSLGLTAQQLTLAQILESATWSGGRKIAKEKRPETSGPPIEIQSDGTVF